ncbi:MAG: hypothetical protein HY332_13040 [Chloroflexi bacterium]|nr:hypothetical protein [Chloroflexota bacterium]
MRIVSLGPGWTRLLCDLGLAGSLVGRAGDGLWPEGAASVPVVARFARTDAAQVGRLEPRLEPTGAPLELTGVPLGYRQTTNLVLDWAAIEAAQPDVILWEEVCPLRATSYTPLGAAVMGAEARVAGRTVRVLSVSPRQLDEVLPCIPVLGQALGVPERAQSFYKIRSARLLALRMHVARYLVRSGATQPRAAVAEFDSTERTSPRLRALGRWVPDMVDAAGGVPALGLPGEERHTITPTDIHTAALGVLLVGQQRAGPRGTAESVAPALFRMADGSGLASARVWAADLDELFSYAGPHLVEGVEALVRIIMPEALGANGTPPLPHQAVPITFPAAAARSLDPTAPATRTPRC